MHLPIIGIGYKPNTEPKFIFIVSFLLNDFIFSKVLSFEII